MRLYEHLGDSSRAITTGVSLRQRSTNQISTLRTFMKSLRILPLSIASATLLLGSTTVLGGDQAVQTIKFSDPSKPGTVKLALGRADIKVQGGDASEVTVKSSASSVSSKPRKDGMRVLSAASSYSFGESDNIITIDKATLGRHVGFLFEHQEGELAEAIRNAFALRLD